MDYRIVMPFESDAANLETTGKLAENLSEDSSVEIYPAKNIR